ncbi:MAG: MBL fold metallo-hydrolase [Prevotella sp.]|nr:MBL fold metallo-hydrolase [Prevotella sp.]
MINIKTFTVNPLQENCYVVSDETQECVIIDCGAYYDAERSAIVNYLKDNALKPVRLLCTHGHFDHAFGNDVIYAEYGLKPEIHAADAHFIADLSRQCDEMAFGIGYSRQSPPVGTLLKDGDTITFGTHRLQVIHTPGHSQGGLCFYCAEEKVVFTGDTLFRMSVGRTDLPGGSWQELEQSLATRIAALPRDTVAYPGHGPVTLMAEEVRMNPYLR